MKQKIDLGSHIKLNKLRSKVRPDRFSTSVVEDKNNFWSHKVMSARCLKDVVEEQRRDAMEIRNNRWIEF